MAKNLPEPAAAFSIQFKSLTGFLQSACRPQLNSLLLFSIIVNVTILGPSFHMLQVYDRVLASGSMSTLGSLTAIVLVALAAYGVAEAARSRIAQRISAIYSISIARKMFARLAQLPEGDQATGRHLRDYAMVKSFLSSRVFVNLFDLPFIPVFIIVLAFVHPLICVLTIVGLIAMIIIGYMNVTMSEAERVAGREADAEATGFAQGAFSHGNAIRALGLLPNLISIWGGKTAVALMKGESAASKSAFYYALGRAVRQGIQVMTMAVGAGLVLAGDMSGGLIFLASMVSGKALAPVEQLIGGWENLSKSIAAFAAMEDITGQDKRLQSRPFLPEPKAVLSAREVHFANKAGREIFSGLSLEVRPGHALLIDGPSGSGASVLLQLLSGATQPDSGAVCVDGNRFELWPAAQWGQIVGYCGENADLLPGSIFANISRFSDNPDKDAIYEAAVATGAHSVIMSLAQGYQTAVNDPDLYLTASQRARIALARALYGRPKIILLDQPTAFLDQPGEGALLNALFAAKQDGACIVLVSRSPLLRKIADCTLVVRDGRLHAAGTPAHTRKAQPSQARTMARAG